MGSIFGGNFDSIWDMLTRWRPGSAGGGSVGRFGRSQLNRPDVNGYQRNRMRDYFQRDFGRYGNSLDRNFLRQRGDLNGLNISGRHGGANIHQGRDGNSINLAKIGGNGHNNLLQHGRLNMGNITGGKSGFLWQGAGDKSTNIAQGMANNNTIWQRGNTNVAAANGRSNDIWQGGYDKSRNFYQGTDKANGRDNVTQVSGDGGQNRIVGGAGHNKGVQQVNNGTSTYDGRNRNGTSDITQRGDGGKKNFYGGNNTDKATFEGNNSKINANMGGGDDTVTLKGRGQTGTIDGGDGNDTLKLDGNLSDYQVSYKAGKDGQPGTYTFTRDGKSFNVRNFENFKIGGRSYSESAMRDHARRTSSSSGGSSGSSTASRPTTERRRA